MGLRLPLRRQFMLYQPCRLSLLHQLRAITLPAAIITAVTEAEAGLRSRNPEQGAQAPCFSLYV
ncbi:hypothetical protein ACI01nite_02370 [Acetobacter cibinongensis]|uniref:Uncharacterized protein n=1 Tax=Acetobacter cibinongensis TaxID=146475 RepID=A0A0D6N2R2_9PROT|nr:hypothetical protein Abci_008_148 [Acetobacter cibinongensis]GBQ16576.1 hypothetical protein AA0482_1612 [Acetobacter cibinongensis NRIC 0482]GEL57635.1 hypothetical protein ACI01nite_02370 [Acetobacter cibinongensis]